MLFRKETIGLVQTNVKGLCQSDVLHPMAVSLWLVILAVHKQFLPNHQPAAHGRQLPETWEVQNCQAFTLKPIALLILYQCYSQNLYSYSFQRHNALQGFCSF